MAGKTRKKASQGKRAESALKKGDVVMVISGGNKKTRPLKGQTAKITRFEGERVVLEGLNLVSRHQKARTQGEASGIIRKEAGIHISNVMLFVEKLKKPVRVRYQVSEKGKKVRGYFEPGTKNFVALDK
jgi:large subunit ribosomal protein L24